MRYRLCRILSAVLFLCSMVFAVLAYKEHKSFAEAKKNQEAIILTVVREPDKAAETTETDSKVTLLDRQIDFEVLQSINPDIVGWIYAPQVGIDLPILKGKNDTEYLQKDFEGRYSPLGSVFTWSHADERLTDRHICLFAHNMISGQMFGNLKKFQEKTFREENRKLYLYTPERVKELEINSVFTCRKTDAVFQDDWNEEESEAQTVTLATCTGYRNTPYRLAVNCRVVREKLVL